MDHFPVRYVTNNQRDFFFCYVSNYLWIVYPSISLSRPTRTTPKSLHSGGGGKASPCKILSKCSDLNPNWIIYCQYTYGHKRTCIQTIYLHLHVYIYIHIHVHRHRHIYIYLHFFATLPCVALHYTTLHYVTLRTYIHINYTSNIHIRLYNIHVCVQLKYMLYFNQGRKVAEWEIHLAGLTAPWWHQGPEVEKGEPLEPWWSETIQLVNETYIIMLHHISVVNGGTNL